MIDLSIVVVSYNTVGLLRNCLRSVHAFVDLRCSEVIVVDNGSTDGSQQMVAREFSFVHLVCNGDNVGFARANNRGILDAQGRYLFLLNSDTELCNPAASLMMDFLRNHADTGIVGGSLRNADGSRQYDCDLFPHPPWRLFSDLVIDRLEPANQRTRRARMSAWTYTEPLEVDWVLGAALMIRRSAMDQVGPLDERFFMYAEDIDWCFRVKRAGWKVVYMPNALVFHRGHASSPSTVAAQAHSARRADESLFKLYRKHYGLAAEVGVRLLTLRRDLAQRLTNRS
jgi:GT2 family glycosyltransferase